MRSTLAWRRTRRRLLMEWNFGDVFVTMLMFVFWVLYISMFFAVFGDIFRRHDLSGWGKAGWTLLIIVLPFVGILAYMVTRPKPTREELAMMGNGYGARGYRFSSADEIVKLAELRAQGAISEEEFARLKDRAVV
jgi:hypothetical protein